LPLAPVPFVAQHPFDIEAVGQRTADAYAIRPATLAIPIID